MSFTALYRSLRFLGFCPVLDSLLLYDTCFTECLSSICLVEFSIHEDTTLIKIQHMLAMPVACLLLRLQGTGFCIFILFQTLFSLNVGFLAC